MPLNARNSRDAHKGAYAGNTEALTLRRRNYDGTMNPAYDAAGALVAPVTEAWIGYASPASESADAAGVQLTVLSRDFLLFNVGCNGVRFRPPQIGDQIGRVKDGSWYDIAPESKIDYKDTSNYGFAISSTKQVVPPVNG